MALRRYNHILWREWRILFPTLSIRKAWNYLLIISSYLLARTIRKPIHWGMPVALGVEPTTACNLRCPQCISGLRDFTRPTGRLDVARFEALIDELHPTLNYLMMYFQGEPYLNPDFLHLVRYASDRKVYTTTSTNGHFLSPDLARATVESGLHRIIVSMDGMSQQTYETYRIGGQLDKVLEGLRNLTEAKRMLNSITPFIDLQFIVFAHNEHEVETVRQLGRELGIDKVSIKAAQVYDFETGHDLIPKDQQYSRYERLADGTWRRKGKLYNHCWKLWQGAEMTWDGRVLPCCFDKDAQYLMGIFPHHSFRQIWRNDAYRNFRQHILYGRDRIEMCRNCTEGLAVWA
jgi:MoaA/NifB/PqqE/SkfB family radical SAM enzyme